jgi:hypothetical protein
MFVFVNDGVEQSRAVAFSGINMKCPQKRHEYVALHAQVAGVYPTPFPREKFFL